MTLKEILEKLAEGEQQFLTKLMADKETELKVAKDTLVSKEADLKKAQDDLTKAGEDLTEAKAKVKEQEAAGAEDIWKGADPKIKQAYEELADKQKKDSEEVRKLSTQIREAEFVEKAKKFEGLSITPEDFGKTLMKVSDADKESYDKVMEVLQTANKAIVEGKLFEEQGRGGKTASGALAKIQEMAKKMSEDSGGKVTKEAAMEKVIEDNPELYKQYKEESEV